MSGGLFGDCSAIVRRLFGDCSAIVRRLFDEVAAAQRQLEAALIAITEVSLAMAPRVPAHVVVIPTRDVTEIEAVGSSPSARHTCVCVWCRGFWKDTKCGVVLP